MNPLQSFVEALVTEPIVTHSVSNRIAGNTPRRLTVWISGALLLNLGAENGKQAKTSIGPMEWFREAFDHCYTVLYSHRDTREARAQTDFILEVLNLSAGDRVLDLACGAGRHSLELARRGLLPVCLDLSEPLIRKAASRARRFSLTIRPVRGDMRQLPFRRVFAAVLSIFTSFGYFRHKREDQHVLHEIARVLRPGGRFLLDTANPAYVRNRLRPFDERCSDRTLIRQWRWFDPQRQRMEKLVVLSQNGRKRRIRESVRCYSREELEEMLEGAGLTPIAAYGDFDASPWHPLAPRTILIAQKRCTSERSGRIK